MGAADFNARYSAKNFDIHELEEAINYSHLRNVKVFLTLNTLVKNSEFNSAVELALKAYNLGIDAIIVQDIGLAYFLIKNFPNLPIHASTQMTCHNLSGTKFLENLGFKRIVLSRELSLSEIEYIKSHTSCEIEVFVHGALCISYSGQCLYSSLIGSRSGNRGKCAQGCRLPYTLLENGTSINNGYLLSPKDLCSLDLLPELIDTNIDSLKIEGRMKSPEYVATVTRIYRKYINKIYNKEKYIVEDQDRKDLLQVFNRGGFSSGHLNNSPNKNLIFNEKPNNIGTYIGNVSNYNSKKGHITLTLNEEIVIGDTITFQNEPARYAISELMQNNVNINSGKVNSKVTIGRMKGNINIGDKVYRLASKELTQKVQNSLLVENIKNPINFILDIHLDEPISLKLYDSAGNNVVVSSQETPDTALNFSITKERLEKQLNKLSNTPFFINNLKINLDNNLFLPHISTINELRRSAISQYTNILINKHKKNLTNLTVPTYKTSSNNHILLNNNISLLLNNLNLKFDYSKLQNIDKLYIPLKYFYLAQYSKILDVLSSKFDLYIYLPSILRANFRNLFKNTIDSSLEKYNIKGFVISNIGNLDLLKEYQNNYEFIGNYTLNIFNNYSCNTLSNLKTITISPELNNEEINDISLNCSKDTEFITYGNIPLMTSNYCLLGNTNKCYPECTQKCKSNNQYYLKDRMNFLFRIIPDNIQTITTIYNSKINSIDPNLIQVNNYRIDILDENIDEINNIINTVKSKKRLEGNNYTSGNLNRCV